MAALSEKSSCCLLGFVYFWIGDFAGPFQSIEIGSRATLSLRDLLDGRTGGRSAALMPGSASSLPSLFPLKPAKKMLYPQRKTSKSQKSCTPKEDKKQIPKKVAFSKKSPAVFPSSFQWPNSPGASFQLPGHALRRVRAELGLPEVPGLPTSRGTVGRPGVGGQSRETSMVVFSFWAPFCRTPPKQINKSINK